MIPSFLQVLPPPTQKQTSLQTQKLCQLLGLALKYSLEFYCKEQQETKVFYHGQLEQQKNVQLAQQDQEKGQSIKQLNNLSVQDSKQGEKGTSLSIALQQNKVESSKKILRKTKKINHRKLPRNKIHNDQKVESQMQKKPSIFTFSQMCQLDANIPHLKKMSFTDIENRINQLLKRKVDKWEVSQTLDSRRRRITKINF